MAILLETNKGEVTLEDETLVFVIDDTGNEDSKDPNTPFFGLGGCAFMVNDYSRLIDIPFNYMCTTYFPNIDRPFHTADVSQNITSEQIEALNHFFTKFQFFRLAVTTDKDFENQTDRNTVSILTAALTLRIVDIAKQATFNRVVVIFEESSRIESLIMSEMHGKKLVGSDCEYAIESILATKSVFSALEVADIIAHTAGMQARKLSRNDKTDDPSFKVVFKEIDERLQSYMHIGKAVPIT